MRSKIILILLVVAFVVVAFSTLGLRALYDKFSAEGLRWIAVILTYGVVLALVIGFGLGALIGHSYRRGFTDAHATKARTIEHDQAPAPAGWEVAPLDRLPAGSPAVFDAATAQRIISLAEKDHA